MSILFVNLGTYCDNTLLLNSIHFIKKKYNVICLVDETQIIPDDIKKYTYKTPKYFLEDLDLDLANPDKNVFFWSIMNPKKSYDALKWTITMKDKILEILNIHKDIKALIVLYPVMPILVYIPEEILASLEVFILYYAPAFPNKEIPWIFDSTIKNKSFNIFKPQTKNIDSSIKYLERIALFSNKNINDIINMFSMINHVICWDLNILKPITPTIKEMHISKIGGIIDWTGKTEKLPDVINCLSKNKKFIFVSFGSYMKSTLVQSNIKNLLDQLENYCMKNEDTHIILHNGEYNSKYTTSYNGYISYHEIVKKSILVIFTGSICLQNICLYHKKAMLYCPILTEQYLWAKNYKYFTKINLYNFELANKIDIKKIIESKILNKYLEKVSKSMHSYDFRKNLYNLVKQRLML